MRYNTSIIKLTKKTFVVMFFLVLLTQNAYSGDLPDTLFARFNTDYEDIVVERVTTSDSIVLEGGERVHLIGLKAPEAPPQERIEYNEYGFRVHIDVDPAGTIEEKALQFARDLMEGKSVRLEFDHQRNDDKLNTVAYVFLKDNTFVNAEILRQGYARLTISPPNLKYAEELRAAYQEARQEKRGLQGE